MSPTIRIDDDVYDWLQGQAVPFDDTPNSVLRRLAGLDEAGRRTSAAKSTKSTGSPGRGKRASGRRGPQARGTKLIEKWGIPVRQAHFHRGGSLYEHLTEFPAALCDRDGYVVFETESAYQECPRLSLGKKVNVRGTISTIPGYQKAPDPLA